MLFGGGDMLFKLLTLCILETPIINGYFTILRLTYIESQPQNTEVADS